MDRDPNQVQRIRDEERMLNACQVAEFLLHQMGRDPAEAERIAHAEDIRRRGQDYGFRREVLEVLKAE